MTNIIEVKDLCKTYIVNKRQNNVLRNVNFSVAPGEMVAVMGPSGSGKSTLLYTVSGMDSLTAGDVIFDGQSIGSMSPRELSRLRLDRMGFVFQQMYMLRSLTIMDNILLPSRQSKKIRESRKEKNERARMLMKRQGIMDVADSGIDEVSGGQLQRACLCRSLINKPDVIFADEPTGALNRAASDEVMDMLGAVNREGTTVMLVTHDVKVAARCTRVMYIVDGNIRGEYNLDIYDGVSPLREREHALTAWLMEMGW